MAADGMTGDLHSVVERRLRRADQRYTPGRRAIVDLLVSTGHPVSIGDIADRLPGLPRSSAYRHLTDLETAGLVRRVAASDEFTRFELAEDLTEHHHHLMCVNCGKVTDVILPAASSGTWARPSAGSRTPGLPAPQPPPRRARHLRRLPVAGPAAAAAAASGPRSGAWQSSPLCRSGFSFLIPRLVPGSLLWAAPRTGNERNGLTSPLAAGTLSMLTRKWFSV